jgi:aminoglycoside phosphotransferase (APT) family kinase protein
MPIRMNDAEREALVPWLRAACDAHSLTLHHVSLLPGGAIQQNWLLLADVGGGPFEGAREWVLRTDAASSPGRSHSRAQEFALLQAAHRAGVRVPDPLFLCTDQSVLGRSFFVMQRVQGIAAARDIVRSDTLGGGRDRLAAALGAELAHIHAIRPPRDDLSFLRPSPDGRIAHNRIADLRARLDAAGGARPVLEWGLRHLERHAPPTAPVVLCHGDFRTGNYLADTAGVAAILDWEFAGWGDPLEDVGWFCARCWRHGGPGEAGGVGSRDAFYDGYDAVSTARLDWRLVRYWELMATVRWAVIAGEQADRHVSGREHSLELALTAHIIPDLELDIMEATGA